MIYAYDDLLNDLKTRKNYFSIGQSVFSREIFAFVKGRGNPHALIFGGIHARECVTADVVMRLYDNYDESLPAICFVPLVNPDGAMLVKYSLDGAEFSSREFLKRVNNNSTDFSKWKANGRAVDLNVNFDADFVLLLKNSLQTQCTKFQA